MKLSEQPAHMAPLEMHQPPPARRESLPMLIFVAMPTKGAVLDGMIRSSVLAWLAALHLQHPQHTFIAPMVQDYQLLPYMPRTEATWADWGKHCRTIIERCDEVWVMKLDGWDTSVGVAGEISHAVEYAVPVVYIEPDAGLTTSLN